MRTQKWALPQEVPERDYMFILKLQEYLSQMTLILQFYGTKLNNILGISSTMSPNKLFFYIFIYVNKVFLPIVETYLLICYI